MSYLLRIRSICFCQSTSAAWIGTLSIYPFGNCIHNSVGREHSLGEIVCRPEAVVQVQSAAPILRLLFHHEQVLLGRSMRLISTLFKEVLLSTCGLKAEISASSRMLALIGHQSLLFWNLQCWFISWQGWYATYAHAWPGSLGAQGPQGPAS